VEAGGIPALFNQMQQINLFSIPLYKFKYIDHIAFKAQAMSYLNDETVYKQNSRKTGLDFTTPNLHQHPAFEEFAKWVQRSAVAAMIDLGFVGKLQLTSLWATRHRDQVGHHMHQHGNSFLAGVYYLNGSNNSSGTTFHNTHYSSNQIMPSRIPNVPMKMSNEITVPFEESTLLIFPSWLRHNVAPNKIDRTGTVRHVLGFNSMPIGITTDDEFDRYNYQDIDNAELISVLPNTSSTTP